MNKIVKDFLKTVLLLIAACIIAYAARMIGEATDIVAVVFVLTVLVVSRVTDRYFWGILASVVGVFVTNVLITYPYFKFNMSEKGYPITFCVMLATSIITSALTTRYRMQKEEAEEMAIQLQKSYEEQRIIERNAEKEKMRSNLLRVISHDLRTPLTGIKGASSAILEGGDKLSDETREKLLKDIIDESQWLIRMVENLLSVTHISEDTMKVKKTPELGEEIIANAVSHFKNTSAQNTIQVHVPDEILIIPMDATLIEQVLLNLLDNATKHCGGNSDIYVNLYSRDNDAVFEVKDNGTGIAEDALPYLFEYGDSKNSKIPQDSQRGFGIGLPTCKTIIAAHSGEIWAESIEGKGSTFSFSLPM